MSTGSNRLNERFADQSNTRRRRIHGALTRYARGKTSLHTTLEAIGSELRAYRTDTEMVGIAQGTEFTNAALQAVNAVRANLDEAGIDTVRALCDGLMDWGLEAAAAVIGGPNVPVPVRAALDACLHRAAELALASTRDVLHRLTGSAPCILLLDDSEIDASMMAAELNEVGYDVISAHDIADFAKKLTYLEPDVLVLDVLMPGLGGDDVCESLKTEFDLPHTPVVLLSSLSAEDLADRAQRVRADAFACKSNGSKSLCEVLTKLLPRRHL